MWCARPAPWNTPNNGIFAHPRRRVPPQGCREPVSPATEAVKCPGAPAKPVLRGRAKPAPWNTQSNAALAHPRRRVPPQGCREPVLPATEAVQCPGAPAKPVLRGRAKPAPWNTPNKFIFFYLVFSHRAGARLRRDFFPFGKTPSPLQKAAASGKIASAEPRKRS